jgi:glutamyl-tRNA synthetase
LCLFVADLTLPTHYRGRLAPSPTGYLHLGHARTFWIAQQRAQAAGGTLILRNDDLDHARCRPDFVWSMYEDLRWFGLRWSEGPDLGGPHWPYNQSERLPLYITAFEHLRTTGFLYPCTCSRQDVMRALTAPHQGEEEPVYPGTCRGASPDRPRTGVNWRFRVPEGETISFHDSALGLHTEIAGRDFGDFLVWRKDDLPSYQMACTVDDLMMDMTEVVRGADLLTSTCRQLLLYRAMEQPAPAFHHCALMNDDHGQRLAKRHDALSLRTLRERGTTSEELRATWTSTP